MPSREQTEQSERPKSSGTRTKEQKQEVNDTHCCVCFKLRAATLLSICLSVLLILVYGYKYWIDLSKSDFNTNITFYLYLIVAGIEALAGFIGWVAVYTHIRSVTKAFAYWIMIHILIISMVFWVSSLFDYLHFGFFIAWIAIQLILLFLLWRFKQVLKIIYGWNDEIDSEQESEPLEATEAPNKLEKNEKDQNKSSVNVSINLTMPQQPQTVYQQPQQPLMPQMPMGYNHMGYNPMMQPMPAQIPQPMYNQYPPQTQYDAQNVQVHVQEDRAIQPVPTNIVSNIPNKAATEVPKEDNVRISVHENVANESEMEQNGRQLSNYVSAEEALKAQLSYSNDTEHEALYDTSNRRNTNEVEKNDKEGGDEGFIIHGESTRDAVSVVERQKAAFDEQRGRRDTPDPPPPPQVMGQRNMEIIDEMKAENVVNDDDEVLQDDFLADIQPDKVKGAETPMNLYFLDPGDEITGGYNEKQ